jgi:hypothetical protein
MNPLKLQIDLNRIAGTPLKAPEISPPKVDSGPRRQKVVTVNPKAPDMLAIFEDVHKIVAATKDHLGNPIGTVYRDDDPTQPLRTRRKESGPRRDRGYKIRVGNIFGDLIVRSRAARVKAARPNLQERYRCECSCGRTIIVPRYYLLRKPNPKTHCGCKVQTLKSQNPREYRIYMMIHQRCYNPKHNSYEHYRSRGITLYPEWHNDKKDGFKKFFEYVNSHPIGPCPSQWHTLDRINNNKGYEPGNLRWATASQQRQNQGDSIGGYTSEQIADMGLTEEEFIEKIISGEIQ